MPPTALITGAASGIGLAAAELLARAGWSIALAGRTPARLEAAAARLSAATLCIPADQADPSAVRHMVDRCAERFGRLDALILNAGQGELRPIERTDPALISTLFAANAIGPACAIHAAWPIMMRQQRGCIILVSSYAALDPFPGFFAYAATKGAMNTMAISCAKEGAPHGIRAFSIAPGAVETDLLRTIFDKHTLPPEHCLAPADIAHVISDCIEGNRDHDNGKTIYLRRSGAKIDEQVI